MAVTVAAMAAATVDMAAMEVDKKIFVSCTFQFIITFAALLGA